MDTRNEIRDYLKRHLVGPRWCEHEVITGRVHLNYMMGILYAQESDAMDMAIDEAMDDSSEATTTSEDTSNDSSSVFGNFSFLPSSAGFSICVDEINDIRVTVRAGIYDEQDRESGKKIWVRSQLEEILEIPAKQSKKYDVFNGRASLRVVSRTSMGHIITSIVLVNELTRSNNSDASLDLFQIHIRCEPTAGRFQQYPRVESPGDSYAQHEKAYNILNKRPYAIGHSVSVDWLEDENGASYVETEYIPCEYVGRPLFDELKIGNMSFEDNDLFSLAYLGGCDDQNELADRLDKMVDFYQQWRDGLGNEDVPGEFREVVTNRLSSIDNTISRMRESISRIRHDTKVFKSFTWANLAMLIQMVHNKKRQGGPYQRGEADTTLPDYLDEPSYNWRPFQLAYALVVLTSLADEDSQWREDVDLVWFSTGGGKTEAYLLISAFILIYRRMKYGDRGRGTAVINRYTYRFLTADQFDRTASLVCALEILREKYATNLGDQPFTVGLWVGGDLTPNRYEDAREKYDKLKDSLQQEECMNAFQIESCPSCGTRMFPDRRIKDEQGNDDDSWYGFVPGAASFKCKCPDESCFFKESLPIAMVDDELYRKPPSFLIGTIDKFANLPWKEQSGVFLGTGSDVEPPSLIIQDELHLISGPLGTIAGIYEAGIESVIRSNNNNKPPKIIASTATISNAEEQSKRLYGRNVKLFPSPGLYSDDSFFQRIDNSPESSRMYLGLMGQGITNTVAVYWSIAALLQGIYETPMSKEETDSYWTLLAYHNSKRELGRTRNAVSDEISSRMQVYTYLEEDVRKLGDPLEISSNAVDSVATARAKLTKKHSESDPAIDVVPCTNMISVGIDIDRLGIMFVNGQPKLTAEYIQATSRVGRRRIPGLVVTALSASKPRDRSHYESFKYYHRVMSTFVEPTSVTPGSYPATERALHAALVTAIRFGTDLRGNTKASNFSSVREDCNHVIKLLESRLSKVYDPNRMENRTMHEHLSKCIQEWENWTTFTGNLNYVANDMNSNGLIYDYSAKERTVGWRTLRSMRFVDIEVNLGVL